MKTALAPSARKQQAIAAALELYRPFGFPLQRLERLLPHVSADRMACELTRTGDRLTVALARTAAAFVAAEGWSPHGYMRLGDFTREVLDRSSRWLRDLAVLGRGLESIPGLDRALLGHDRGAPIGRVAGTCIARVATPDTVQAWLALARRSTIRQLQDAVRTARQAKSAAPVTTAGADPDRRRVLEEDEAARQAKSAPPVATAGDDPDRRRVLEEDEEETNPCDVRFVVKRPVMTAFEETHDLHRAIVGHQTSLAAFVEALTGEAASGFAPPDVDIVPRVPTLPDTITRALEERLAHTMRFWEDLGPRPSVREELRIPDSIAPNDTELAMSSAGAPACDSRNVPIEISRHANGRTREHHGNGHERVASDEPESLTQRIEAALDHFERLSQSAGQGSVAVLARQLHDLVHLETEIERALGRLLSQMRARGDHVNLGFASVAHYAEQRLGMSRRTAERRAGIRGALQHLPRALAAYENGKLGLQAAWLIRRIVGSKPVSADLERALVAQGHQVTVKRMQHEALAAGLRARGLLDSPNPEPRWPSTDAQWHDSLWRSPGMSRQRVARLGQQALQKDCDNVFLRMRLPEETATLFLASVESSCQQLAREARSRPNLDETDASVWRSLLAARRFVERAHDVPAWVGLLGMLEEFVQTWDDPHHFKKHEWGEIHMRDGYRCMAPGCTSRRNLEAHHLIYRSDLGSDHPCNLYLLCKGHHQRGEHGRLARCKGKAPLGVTWRLGQPDLATWFRNERKIQTPEGDISQERWWS